MLLLNSFGPGSVPLSWVLVAAWGTVLAGLVFRCPHASVDVVALAAAAEMGVFFPFSPPILRMALNSALSTYLILHLCPTA